MTITIHLSPDVERQLRERAARAGRDVEALAHELLERGIGSEPTLDEILAPFRKQVAESGMSDEELDAFFEEMRDEVHRERQGAGS
jgi:plasmid stability protein